MIRSLPVVLAAPLERQLALHVAVDGRAAGAGGPRGGHGRRRPGGRAAAFCIIIAWWTRIHFGARTTFLEGERRPTERAYIRIRSCVSTRELPRSWP